MLPLIDVLFACSIAVVERLKSFLPEMAAANTQLDQQIESSPEECNIENISESDERVIEMVSGTLLHVRVNVIEQIYHSFAAG